MPLPPIVLTPAYRHGGQTPWGGNSLRALYHKECPEQTGESLELSALPGLESRDSTGRTLSELVAEHGEALLGSRVRQPFPLLIKLIDARQQLSVQVHPDDGYAQMHHGKLGKNEAWVILNAGEGAKLVLGLKEGVSSKELEKALRDGASVKGLLREFAVKPGDAVYIPAGTVHAIGAGLVLYEIQQSSDVTYRLYDWDRADSAGKKRELHLQEALDVLDEASRPETIQAERLVNVPRGIHERLLKTSYFTLDRLKDCDGFPLQADKACFRALTALEPLSLRWENEELRLAAGQTALLPADGYPLLITGKNALLAAPGV